MTIDITLLIVAYHPSQNEVLRLKSCLDSLPSNISYAVAVNDYVPADFIDILELDSEFFLRITENIGYGRAINRLFLEGGIQSEYIGILNTDLSWRVGTFEAIHDFLQNNSDVSLLAPQILGEHGEVHMLCKRSPTVLGMFSRRFLPNSLKPLWLREYDLYYCMHEYDYSSIFDVPYLSGCCMVARSSAFESVGGFDETYFLYLEDADLTRLMSKFGRCVHYPHASVVHRWGRGNYRSIYLMFVNLLSAYRYFSKWGLKLW